MSDLTEKRDRLLELIGGYGTCAVAFSGGIDSTVVAKAAQLALGSRAVAVTGTSASLAAGELEEAVELARLIGIRHEVIATDEFSNADYLRNAPDRCYHCKTELYTRIEGMAEQLDVAVVLNGANLDDLGDYRPGMNAAAEHRVASPLAECGFHKADVRALAAAWELPIWDKPATPCLSSRVANGEAVTPERLAMIDAAERWLRARGLPIVRVRYHTGDMARLEVPLEALAELSAPRTREPLVAHLKGLGFKYVTLDLEGFRSGSLNALVSISGMDGQRSPVHLDRAD
jgi:pyridinium-3,5-biscarboxylic acid mononucleotide sulfurtransferase